MSNLLGEMRHLECLMNSLEWLYPDKSEGTTIEYAWSGLECDNYSNGDGLPLVGAIEEYPG